MPADNLNPSRGQATGLGPREGKQRAQGHTANGTADSQWLAFTLSLLTLPHPHIQPWPHVLTTRNGPSVWQRRMTMTKGTHIMEDRARLQPSPMAQVGYT